MRCARVLAPLFLSLVLLLAIPEAEAGSLDPPSGMDVVRVRLFEREHPSTLTVVAAGGSIRFYVDQGSVAVAELADGESVTIGTRAGELYAAFLDGGIHALTFRIVPDEGTLVGVARLGERTPEPQPAYSGAVRLSLDREQPDRLFVVNDVDLESYVAAVVDQEYGLDAVEGAKALAVAVRTYTIRARGKFGDAFDHVDHVRSQVFRGVGAIRPMARQAARETEGEVLAYRGELIEAVYFASSGGHTADNERVWASDPRPYLRGKPDPYDVNPDRNWQTTLAHEKVLDALSTHVGSGVEGFVIDQRSNDGRAETVDLLLAGGQRTSIRGTVFRNALNQAFGHTTLRSTNFTAVRRGDSYLFEGTGSGHGVGLPQWGAYGMAARGRSYRDILAYYYTGVHVVQQSDVAYADPREDADGKLPVEGIVEVQTDPHVAADVPFDPADDVETAGQIGSTASPPVVVEQTEFLGDLEPVIVGGEAVEEQRSKPAPNSVPATTQSSEARRIGW